MKSKKSHLVINHSDFELDRVSSALPYHFTKRFSNTAENSEINKIHKHNDWASDITNDRIKIGNCFLVFHTKLPFMFPLSRSLSTTRMQKHHMQRNLSTLALMMKYFSAKNLHDISLSYQFNVLYCHDNHYNGLPKHSVYTESRTDIC